MDVTGSVEVVRSVPSWVFGRLEYETGVSGVAWRNALVSALVGIVAMVVTAFILR